MSPGGQKNYRKIIAWQRAHQLTLRIYRVTATFPKTEIYGLTSQLRRSAYSVGANISEGSGRGTNRDFLRFLYIALGSLKETEYGVLVAQDLGYMDQPLHDELTREIAGCIAPLQGLIRKVSAEVNPTPESGVDHF